MRRLARAILGLALVGAALGGAAFWGLTRPASLSAATLQALAAHPADATAGARVFWAAGCAGCHAAPGLDATSPLDARLVLSGGRRLESPFGTFMVPNVSAHPQAGIGGWTREQFARAVLLGVSPEGRHYYPAFPYASYARMTPAEVADLWAFWQDLPADATPSAPHELGFPFTVRRGLGLWKALHLNAAYVTPTATDPQLVHGRHLVEALGHCAECHTPRDATGGLQVARWLEGAPNPSGRGRIPALPPEGWSAEDIEAYLFSGFTPSFDVAGGAMADVVVQMAQLPPEDRAAIAAYLVALRASPSR